MAAASIAAAEINERWHECLRVENMIPATCPTDDEVAVIIARHCDCSKQEGSHGQR